MPHDTNSIEKKSGMNCCTCEINLRCKFFRSLSLQQKQDQICKYYTNEPRGEYDSPRKRKSVEC